MFFENEFQQPSVENWFTTWHVSKKKHVVYIYFFFFDQNGTSFLYDVPKTPLDVPTTTPGASKTAPGRPKMRSKRAQDIHGYPSMSLASHVGLQIQYSPATVKPETEKQDIATAIETANRCFLPDET